MSKIPAVNAFKYMGAQQNQAQPVAQWQPAPQPAPTTILPYVNPMSYVNPMYTHSQPYDSFAPMRMLQQYQQSGVMPGQSSTFMPFSQLTQPTQPASPATVTSPKPAGGK